jgi:hypothetical protein
VLRAARTVAVTLAARPARARRWPAALAWALAGLTVLTFIVASRLTELVWSTGWEPRPSNGTLGAVALVVVSTAMVGALVASRRPRHPVGWLLLGVGLALVGSLLVQSYVDYGLLARPGSLPGARYLAGFSYSTVPIWLSCAGFVLLLTPTGSLPSPRWRWWARVMAVAPAALLGSRALLPRPFYPPFQSVSSPLAVHVLVGPLTVVWVASWAVTYLGLVVAIASLVVRSRRARGTERQQLRWVALGAWLSVLALVMVLARPGARQRRHHQLGGRRPAGDPAAGHGGGDPALPAV